MDFIMNEGSSTMDQQNMDANNDKNMLWMQNNYQLDSGIMSHIDSGLVSEKGTRAPPSVYDNYDELETTDLFDFDVQDNNFDDMSHDFEEIQTQGDESVIFSDILEKEPLSELAQLSNENIQHMGQHYQLPENSVENFNPQLDNPIPNLIKCLYDDDLVIVNHAVKMVFQLSKTEAHKIAIMNNPQIVTALIRTIVKSNDLETARLAVNTLHNISLHKDACRNTIMNSPEIVPTLVRATTIIVDVEIRRTVINTLHNISSGKETCQSAILNCPEMLLTLERLIPNVNDVDMARIVISILLNVLLEQEACWNAKISYSEMAAILMRIITNVNDVVCVKKAMTVFRNLSMEKEARLLMCCPELVTILTRAILRPTDLEITQLVVSIIKNISSEKETLQSTGVNAPEKTYMPMQTQSNSDHFGCKVPPNASYNDTCSNVIINNSELVPALVRILIAINDLEIQKTVIGILHNISITEQGLDAIVTHDGIPVLVKFLRSIPGALVVIHNFLLSKKDYKVAICKAGGLQTMVSLLRNDNVKFLTIVTDCLYTLAYGNQENKLIILASRGPSELVRILRTFQYEKLLWHTAKVLKVLSACSNNKKAIVQAGGMQALGTHLNYAEVASLRLVKTALWTIRNLSDAAREEIGLDQLLHEVVQLLNLDDEEVVTVAAGILSNLTCNNERNKLTVCCARGIEALVQAIAANRELETITEPAVCALRHITSRHSEAKTAQNQVRVCRGIHVIVDLLRPTSGWPLIKAVIGLIRNLAQCPLNHDLLRELGVVHHLSNLLIDVYQEQKSKSFGMMSGELHDGVRMEEIIEGSVGALHVLARDANNRTIIRSQQIIPIFRELLYDNNQNIQRVADSILREFV